MAIKCILFDFWGTVVENGVFPSPIRQAQRILWIKQPFSDYVVRFENVLMTQKFESLPDAFYAVGDEFRVRIGDHQMEQLIGIWNKNRLLAKPYKETLDVLKELKSDYKLVLIANTDNFSIEPLLDKFKLSELFDEVILSYETGLLKTDPKMFELALEKVGCSKEEAVMVGDSMETDILGAERAGIKAILVDRRDKREHQNKITDLGQLKEMLNAVSN